ncbi:MAG: hypothetical protein E6K76_11945 [Candidatus Eisenbacteria bacterium]|uniref:Uncharacterized protein n=1 Tax=Eiseniibacteriota bacterium TaxID=2212470 RepID=A0A538SZV9_UNCEI|nr:MAG: hypothetical protein E6K76_11945 [Candidatus Eisenbacteria bacterium]
MNRFSLLLVSAIAAVALVGAPAALATTVQKLTLQELTKKSESIVMARVDDAVSSWDAGHREIYSYYTLRVLQPVKGSKGATTITLRQLGGTVGTIASIVPGMPSFRKGEEVVLFLTQKDAAGYPWVMGLQQGKYSIVTAKDGVKMVRNDLAGTELLSKSGGRVESTTAPDMPLNAFLDGIKTSLDEAGKIQVDPNPPTE